MSNGIIDIGTRYDQFQAEAVANILNDYRDNPDGRFLLVIPTGGGKTFTAVKAINKLFEEGILNSNKDRVLWTAHKTELKNQAQETFDKFKTKHPNKSYLEQVDFKMISGAQAHIQEHPEVKIVVIDEAHHAKISNVQYGPLFDYPNLGILGLTATPSRHDGAPLKFEKESYSIGFPDLAKKQIILNPEIREIEGGRFEKLSIRGTKFSGLEDLETEERDQRIISHIQKYNEDYNKIIVFVGSVNHTENLCRKMNESALADLYESIDYIHGGSRSGNEDRNDFIERIKSHKKSIVINYNILEEGYDDPSVNTVIMARPSQSKLVYMQAVGRAIRANPHNPNKTAYIVEVADSLPNIRYRIDNRWLFSEISDSLEPAVEDEFFGSAQEFSDSLKKIYSAYNVDKEHQIIPEWNKSYRYALLLFRSLARIDDSGNKIYRHFPILIDNENRMAVSNWFNFLSERMEKNRNLGIAAEPAMQMSRYHDIGLLQDEGRRQLVYEAMETASEIACSEHRPDKKPIQPWITFTALRYRENEVDQEVQDFIGDIVNHQMIENQVKEKTHVPGAKIIKFPLPLSSHVGQVITPSEFEKLEGIINQLKELKDNEGNQDHRNAVRDLLDNSILPVDMIFRESLPIIVREDIQYHLTIN